jgi:dTDP-4-dehydrorhamnose 3,5-epimerase
MTTSEYQINLERHETKDVSDAHINGSLTVVWRDWDNLIKNHPKMIYVSSVNPGEIKGPHIHTKRTSHFVCIEGKVVFIIKKNDGTFDEIISSDEHPVMINIPKNSPSAHINLLTKVSRILALADIAWKPNDNEMQDTTFDNYDWKKWKI